MEGVELLVAGVGFGRRGRVFLICFLLFSFLRSFLSFALLLLTTTIILSQHTVQIRYLSPEEIAIGPIVSVAADPGIGTTLP